MKKILALLTILSTTALSAHVGPLSSVQVAAQKQDATAAQLWRDLARYQAAEKAVAQHLIAFDTLDFEVFTHQKWERIHESHAKDIKVHWPDGRITVGVEPHVADLKAMFVYAPDTRIETHPVKVGQGEWTAVIGVLEGTFTRPMPLPNGQQIPPTGKPFKITMATIGHWTNGVMDEEYLFWDNLTFMQQIGLAQ